MQVYWTKLVINLKTVFCISNYEIYIMYYFNVLYITVNLKYVFLQTVLNLKFLLFSILALFVYILV